MSRGDKSGYSTKQSGGGIKSGSGRGKRDKKASGTQRRPSWREDFRQTSRRRAQGLRKRASR